MDYLADELHMAIEAAREAGGIARDSYAQLGEHEIDEKAENDMVTVVDVRAQGVIVERIRGQFPDDYIVAEENLDASVNEGIGADASRRWYIDPLDGTTNYIHSYPMFAVSIALEIEGRLDLGVTYAPMLDEMYHAVRGRGAYLNGDALKVSRISDNNRILLGTGFPFRARRHLDTYLASFRHFFDNARGVRRAGSATIDFAWLAAGRLDGFWEMTLSPWDMAAGVVLIEEAGGRVTDFYNKNDYLTSGHVVATNGLFHDWMCEGLTRIFPPDRDWTSRD